MSDFSYVNYLRTGKKMEMTRKPISKAYAKFASSEDKYLLVTEYISQGGEQNEYRTAMSTLLPFKNKIVFVQGNQDLGYFFIFPYENAIVRYFDMVLVKELNNGQKYSEKNVFKKVLSDSDYAKVFLVGLNLYSKKPPEGGYCSALTSCSCPLGGRLN